MNNPRSSRLAFEQYRQTDEPLFTSLVTDSAVMKHVGNGALSQDEAQALWKKLTEVFYPRGDRTIWGLFSRDDNRYVGHASIRPRPDYLTEWEIGYIFRRSEWGNGFATETAKALVKFGFEHLGLDEVFATVDDEHTRSINVLHKAGLKFARYDFDDRGRYSVFSIPRGNSEL